MIRAQSEVGGGRRLQVFQATVPPGCSPGGMFEVDVEGQRMQLHCPMHCNVGTVFQLKPYQVAVPTGVGPGMRFMANVSGSLFPVTVPADLPAGETMIIHAPKFPPDLIGWSSGGSNSNAPSNSTNNTTGTSNSKQPANEREESKVKMQSDIVLPKAVAQMDDEEIPNEFICPITQEVMTNPVMAMDGHTYELAAIERWLLDKDTSPKTNDKLPSTVLIPNQAMRSQIIEFFENKQRRGSHDSGSDPSAVTPNPPENADDPPLNNMGRLKI